MIEELLKNPVESVVGFGAGLTGIIFFVRFVRRMYYTEKRDTSIDLASQSVFENLRLENERMAKQLGVMSVHLETLSRENNALNLKVAELSNNIQMLLRLEQENKELRNQLLEKDEKLLEKDQVIEELSRSLIEALEAVRLRGMDKKEKE